MHKTHDRGKKINNFSIWFIFVLRILSFYLLIAQFALGIISHNTIKGNFKKRWHRNHRISILLQKIMVNRKKIGTLKFLNFFISIIESVFVLENFRYKKEE